MSKQSKIEVNLSTEEKFKAAARIVFTKKGYAATKTRDIAAEAGLNLALLNYYFRSKEKLFELIMIEKVEQLFTHIAPIINDSTSTLNEKIDQIAINYIDMLLENPDLPLFVLSEMNRNPERFGKIIRLDTHILNSRFIAQLAEVKKEINPIQLFITFLGMLIFPFISKPVFQSSGTLSEALFCKLMEERKELTAKWMKMILE
ncbi:MAG: TetR/AcrR family transcriptional regulator [Bacteroidota bacterium]